MLYYVEAAPAKINTYLAVTGRRADGYHTLLSHMQTVSLSDTLEFSYDSDKIEFSFSMSCDDARLPTDGNNLICRAAMAFYDCLRKNEGAPTGRVTAKLTKRIPMAAGLGGGSADAAATLRALNFLFGEPFSLDQLCAIGARLGADIPFCLRGGAMTARGIGEILLPEISLPDHTFLLIACHGDGVSTPAAYSRLDELGCTDADAEVSYACFVDSLKTKDLAAIGEASYNCFETAVLPTHEGARMLLATMRENGVVFARMSGSGPSVVGYFANEQCALECADLLAKKGVVAHLCRPI